MAQFLFFIDILGGSGAHSESIYGPNFPGLDTIICFILCE